MANVKRGGDDRAAMNSADGRKNVSAEPEAKKMISTEQDAKSSMQPNKISGSSLKYQYSVSGTGCSERGTFSLKSEWILGVSGAAETVLGLSAFRGRCHNVA